MERTATRESWCNRLDEVARFLIRDSGLGLALRFVDSHLLDHALGWALSHPDSSPRQMVPMAGYLFWGTAFRLRPVFPDRFSKLAMGLCLDSGAASFPLRKILAGVLEAWPSLGYRRSSISRPFRPNGAPDAAEARDAVDDRINLFLSVAQEIPFTEHEGASRSFDWDHVYPQAGRSRMKWWGERGKDRCHLHPDAWLVFRGGNLCLLDSSTNRQLQDLGPNEKLSRLEGLERSGALQPGNLFLDEKDRRRLREVDGLLDERSVAEAMRVFRRFVERREDRLWQCAGEAFPQIEVFRDELFAK